MRKKMNFFGNRRWYLASALCLAMALTGAVGLSALAEDGMTDEEQETAADASEVAGTYTSDSLTLVLNADYTCTLDVGGDLALSGTFTYEAVSGFFGSSTTTVILDDACVEALAELESWYWDGTITLDQDKGEYLGTFSLSLDIDQAVIAQGGENGYTAVTVEDEESPTGYMTTITLPDDGYETVYAYGSWVAYSMDLTDEEDPTSYSEEGVEPEGWENGMYYNSESVKEMTKTETDEGTVWTLEVPLASSVMGCQCYHDVTLEDLSDIRVSDENKFYVPYDEEKQSDSFDWAVAFSNEEAAGTVDKTVVCTTDDGYEIQLAVYVPYGYDAEDTDTQYPVLYLIPGGGTTYVTWFDSGLVNNVFDNLTEQGVTSPTILVSMDRQDAIDYLISDIIPYIEENYQAYTDAEHRAVVGTSMGGVATTQFWLTDTELFAYYGFFSGADSLFKNEAGDFSELSSGIADMSEEYWNNALDGLKNTTILIGGGTTDFNMFEGDDNSATIQELDAWLTYYEIEHGYSVYGGGHSWTTWTQLMLEFATDYLWQ